MTARLIRACENPYVTIIGHPTGRNVETAFPGYEFDYDAVFAAAARTGTALEIDGQPTRLDLPSALGPPRARVRRNVRMRLGRARRRRNWPTSRTPSGRRGAPGLRLPRCSTHGRWRGYWHLWGRNVIRSLYEGTPDAR